MFSPWLKQCNSICNLNATLHCHDSFLWSSCGKRGLFMILAEVLLWICIHPWYLHKTKCWWPPLSCLEEDSDPHVDSDMGNKVKNCFQYIQRQEYCRSRILLGAERWISDRARCGWLLVWWGRLNGLMVPGRLLKWRTGQTGSQPKQLVSLRPVSGLEAELRAGVSG